MTVLADEFTQIFREEHREVRDTLLELIRAFEEHDRPRAASLLERAASITGPHFRYEEAALYPALVGIFGEEYIEHLYGDHDRAIGAAQRLVELAGHDPLGEENVGEATRLVRSILPHVSDCDGLSIMVEVLPPEKVQSIFDARGRALEERLDLLTWAEQMRDRPVAVPE